MSQEWDTLCDLPTQQKQNTSCTTVRARGMRAVNPFHFTSVSFHVVSWWCVGESRTLLPSRTGGRLSYRRKSIQKYGISSGARTSVTRAMVFTVLAPHFIFGSRTGTPFPIWTIQALATIEKSRNSMWRLFGIFLLGWNYLLFLRMGMKAGTAHPATSTRAKEHQFSWTTITKIMIVLSISIFDHALPPQKKTTTYYGQLIRLCFPRLEWRVAAVAFRGSKASYSARRSSGNSIEPYHSKNKMMAFYYYGHRKSQHKIVPKVRQGDNGSGRAQAAEPILEAGWTRCGSKVVPSHASPLTDVGLACCLQECGEVWAIAVEALCGGSRLVAVAAGRAATAHSPTLQAC
ncbi:hypothetical protein EJ06DRAFT_52096 [Trichodelitschia bisporula]|uniref:Uncharacterized protein n=1 Tax=Trichodelitschia bisporula TaxID=703511 RepID=A0A6G1HTQ4_9PEZI|nr:hypothetical protein EJ06DRAFT_52096 [Trichodelitschia bisporula]